MNARPHECSPEGAEAGMRCCQRELQVFSPATCPLCDGDGCFLCVEDCPAELLPLKSPIVEGGVDR